MSGNTARVGGARFAPSSGRGARRRVSSRNVRWSGRLRLTREGGHVDLKRVMALRSTTLSRCLTLALALCGALAFASPRLALAGCDNVPSAIDEFRAAEGAITAPYAVPGQRLQVRVRPQVCDRASAGLGAAPACLDGAAVRVAVIFAPGGDAVEPMTPEDFSQLLHAAVEAAPDVRSTRLTQQEIEQLSLHMARAAAAAAGPVSPGVCKDPSGPAAVSLVGGPNRPLRWECAHKTTHCFSYVTGAPQTC